MSDLARKLAKDIPILLYTHTQLVGGIAGYTSRLALGLCDRGYRVAVLCRADGDIEPMRQRLRDAGIEVNSVDMADYSRLGRIKRIRDFASVVRKYPGCVLGLMMGDFNTGALISAAGTLGGARAIVRGDLQPPMPLAAFDLRYAMTHRLRDLLVDRTVVGAAENVGTLVDQLGLDEHKIDVVHTGIDVARFDPAVDSLNVRESLGVGADEPIVGMISRLEEDSWRKGADRFVEMAADLASDAPHARFVVVGDGAARPTLEGQARRLGLGNRIVFAGWRSDIPQLLKEMDVFVMPSLYEGGPTSVLEAMAMARPVVATRVGMVPEVVQDGETGLIVEPGDVHGMARAVRGLLADDQRRKSVGENAREIAARNFGFEAMVRGYLSVFAKAVESPRRIWRGAAPRRDQKPARQGECIRVSA